jgi:hypothetical protein
VTQQRPGAHHVRLARGDAVDDDPPERRERFDRRVEDLAAGGVEHEIDLAALVRLEQPLGQAVGLGPDSDIGAQRPREVALLPTGGGGDHTSCTETRGELGGERADAPRRRVHDDALTCRETAGRAKQMPGRRALDHERQRGPVVDPVGDCEDPLAGRDGVLRIAARPDQRDDSLAGLLERSGDLAARHQRQRRLLHV